LLRAGDGVDVGGVGRYRDGDLAFQCPAMEAAQEKLDALAPRVMVHGLQRREPFRGFQRVRIVRVDERSLQGLRRVFNHHA